MWGIVVGIVVTIVLVALMGLSFMDIGVRCFCAQSVLNCVHFGTAIGQQDAITVLNKYDQPINNLFR